MISDATGWFLNYGVDPVRSAGRTPGLIPDVLIRAIEIGPHREVRTSLSFLQRPCMFGAVNLLEVSDARGPLTASPRFDEVRNRDGSQQADDCHHNHDFY